MGVGGRQSLGGCKRSVNFLPEFPIVLSENLPEWNGLLPNLGWLQPPYTPPPTLMGKPQSKW